MGNHFAFSNQIQEKFEAGRKETIKVQNAFISVYVLCVIGISSIRRHSYGLQP